MSKSFHPRANGWLGFIVEIDGVRYAHVIDPRDGGPETGSVHDLTQWYTTHLEAMIRRVPQQYWWLHRRWKERRRRPRAKRAA